MEFEIGTIVEGKVTGVTGFGAFVDLGEGKTGMVHVSEVSRTYVKDIKEFVKEGDTVKAKIISVEGGKISLSMKQLQEEKRPARRDKSERKYVFSGRPENVDWSNKSADLSFEEMMSKFKSRSEEKISDLKRNVDGKRGTSYRKR